MQYESSFGETWGGWRFESGWLQNGFFFAVFSLLARELVGGSAGFGWPRGLSQTGLHFVVPFPAQALESCSSTCSSMCKQY